MRVVVDTNVFVSAALKTVSWPADMVRRIDAHGGLLKSAATEQELLAVLDRPRLAVRITAEFRTNLQRILEQAELVAVMRRFSLCRDPDDDKFLEFAVAGGADVLVSGDADLLSMQMLGTIATVSPAEFLHGLPR